MLKTQFPGVKHLPRESFCEFGAVDFIAENGMAKMTKMDADLVRPAAVQFAFEQTHFF
jgi:hypothetical protein